MFDDQKNRAAVFCLRYNITKYVAQELQLQDAKEEIEKNSGMMKKIIFQQSHLIRAPLSNIIGLAMILDKTSLEANTANIIGMISESVDQLDEVIKSTASIASE